MYESCSLCVAMYALYGLSWVVIPPEILNVVKIDTTMYDTNEGEAIFVRRRLCCVNPAVKEAIVKGNDSCSKSVLSKGSIPSFCKAYPKHFSASLHSLTHSPIRSNDFLSTPCARCQVPLKHHLRDCSADYFQPSPNSPCRNISPPCLPPTLFHAKPY